MKRYYYTGKDPFLKGTTALGQIILKVQVDDLGHPWSIFWHETSQEDWIEILDDKEPYPYE